MTKEQLIEELKLVRRQNAEWKASGYGRAQANEVLRKTACADDCPNVVMIMDAKGSVEYVNPKFTQVSGYVPEEVIGTNAQDLGEQSAEENKRMWETITSGREWRGEFYNRRKNGGRYWESAFISPIRNTEGRVTHFVKVAEDVTERKQREKELQESKERYRKLIETANDAIFVADAETGIILYANKRAEELIGLPEREIVGMHQGQLHPKEEVERYKKIFKDHTRNGKAIASDLFVVHKDGRRIPVEISASVIELGGKKLIQGIFRDVTERKQMEEELRARNKSLEQRVAERTAELERVNAGLQAEIAERKRAEEELRGKEALASSIIDGMTDMVIVVNPDDFKIVSANKAYLEKEGLSTEDMVGKTCYEVLHGLSESCKSPDCKCPMYETIKTGKTAAEEHIYYDEKGEKYYEEVITAPLFNGEKKLTQVMHISRDITQRKRVEEALRESKALLQGILDNSPAPIYIKDAEYRFIYVNRHGENLLHMTNGQILGKTDYDIFPEEVARVLQENDQKVLESGSPLEVEESVLLSDGTRTYISVKFPLFNSKGVPYAVCGISTDITKSKLTEGALRESEHKFRSLVESSQDGILAYDRDLRYIFWNPAMERISGVRSKELLGQRAFDVFPFLEEVGEADAFRDAVKGKATARMAMPYSIPKTNRHGYFESSHFPLVDAQGSVIGGMAIIRDVTERKRGDEERKQSLEKLRQALGGTVQALARTAEMRDPYTANHQRHVADLARAIAEEMGLSSEQIEGIRMAGLVHDVGKVAVPAEILSKPGRITEAEFSMIKVHSRVGYDILKDIEFPWRIAEIVLQHHEKMDGSGYPLGLSDGDIIMEARILCVADVVEAMASHRPYRPALGIEEALREISKNRGILYDADVVGACVRLFREKRFEFK